MSVSDPIADMLTRIRNANKARLDNVVMPSSGLKAEIAKIMYEEGYISSFEVIDGKTTNGILKIHLRYNRNKSAIISGLKRISKPGQGIYRENKDTQDTWRAGNCGSFNIPGCYDRKKSKGTRYWRRSALLYLVVIFL